MRKVTRSALLLVTGAVSASGCLSIIGGDVDFTGKGGAGGSGATSTGTTSTGTTSTGTTSTGTTSTGTTSTTSTSTTSTGTGGTGGAHPTCGGGQACANAGDCTPTGTICSVNTCDNECCGTINATLGTLCTDNGGVVCTGNGTCTASHCMDGIKDANETDVDCGGSCPPCAYGEQCLVNGDCATAFCAPGSTCGAATIATAQASPDRDRGRPELRLLDDGQRGDEGRQRRHRADHARQRRGRSRSRESPSTRSTSTGAIPPTRQSTRCRSPAAPTSPSPVPSAALRTASRSHPRTSSGAPTTRPGPSPSSCSPTAPPTRRSSRGRPTPCR